MSWMGGGGAGGDKFFSLNKGNFKKKIFWKKFIKNLKIFKK